MSTSWQTPTREPIYTSPHRDTGARCWKTEGRKTKWKTLRLKLSRLWKSTCPWLDEEKKKFKLALSFVSTPFPVGDMEQGERLQEAPWNNILLSWCLTKTARVSQAKQKTRNFFSALPGKGSQLPHHSSHSLNLAPTIGMANHCWSAPTLLHALPRSLPVPHGATCRDQCCGFTSTHSPHYPLNSKDSHH